MEFKGKGEHSVNDLEKICINQQESLHQKQIINQELLKENQSSLKLFHQLKAQEGFVDVGGHVGAAIFRLNKALNTSP